MVIPGLPPSKVFVLLSVAMPSASEPGLLLLAVPGFVDNPLTGLPFTSTLPFVLLLLLLLLLLLVLLLLLLLLLVLLLLLLLLLWLLLVLLPLLFATAGTPTTPSRAMSWRALAALEPAPAGCKIVYCFEVSASGLAVGDSPGEFLVLLLPLLLVLDALAVTVLPLTLLLFVVEFR